MDGARSRLEREPSLTTGSRISAYQIERSLGSGGMGSVFQARHVLDGHIVALKVLREDQLRQGHAVERMMREAAVLASVRHRGIPRFFECGMLADHRPWIAMELVDGRPLSAELSGRRMPSAVVGELVGHLADVLAAAHARGVTHRDLKPENVLLTPEDNAFPLRVIDWGIAIQQSAPRFTNHDEAIGTPKYMAPEQARGGPASNRTDIYGLGVVAYEALAGSAPFTRGTPVEILVQHLSSPVPSLTRRCPDAPVGLCELIERMLAKRDQDRPTATEVREALRDLRAATDTLITAPQYALPDSEPDSGSPPTAVLRR